MPASSASASASSSTHLPRPTFTTRTPFFIIANVRAFSRWCALPPASKVVNRHPQRPLRPLGHRLPDLPQPDDAQQPAARVLRRRRHGALDVVEVAAPQRAHRVLAQARAAEARQQQEQRQVGRRVVGGARPVAVPDPARGQGGRVLALVAVVDGGDQPQRARQMRDQAVVQRRQVVRQRVVGPEDRLDGAVAAAGLELADQLGQRQRAVVEHLQARGQLGPALRVAADRVAHV
ncbi:hypothetical protein A7D00_4409 [Trichophyton violaceum]|uniref:Uncharacterized protein n=1 Tax=Trichophyton violaceum TaxID=34388 RepID=A0A178FJ84_TRIVO|nr:hypothetical protein A7D00_4409 [Trichophyton violaceum]